MKAANFSRWSKRLQRRPPSLTDAFWRTENPPAAGGFFYGRSIKKAFPRPRPYRAGRTGRSTQAHVEIVIDKLIDNQSHLD
jgi:hypothetical protein